jgi:hypothetical protein
MKLGRTIMLAIALAAIPAACRGDNDQVGVRDQASTERGERQATAALSDEEIIAQLKTIDTIGRNIYDPPPDLSLTSAQLRRPDLFRPPQPPTKAPATPGGGAQQRDTSGGAARPQPGRP